MILLKLYFTKVHEKKLSIIRLSYKTFTHCFQQEEMVSTSEGRTQVFVARKYLQVS